MPEQVNVASLSIDVSQVIKESVKLQEELDTLKKTQKDLKIETKEDAVQYDKLTVDIKRVSKAYKDNTKFASDLEKTNEELNKTISAEGKSVQELYNNRRQLQGVVKGIKGNTEKEIADRNRLNKAIDAQTEAIREQSSEFNAGKDQIGEYTKGINASDLSLQSLIKNSEEAGGATNLVSGGLKAAKKAMIGFTKSALAFLLTPIGLAIGVLAGAFLLVKNAMNRSEESTNKIKKSMSGLTGIFKFLLKILEPLGKFLIEGIAEAFETVEKVIAATLEGIQKALDFLGFDRAAESMANFNKEIAATVKASKDLVDAELDLAKAQRFARKTQLDFQKGAEKLRQIRDDETKSIPERIQANKELGDLLKKQGEEELAIAEKALKVAELRIKLEGETTEALDERAAALTEIADIEERITGQTSEQLVNRVALQKEAADKIREIEDAKAEATEEAARRKMEADKEAAEAAIELARHELNNYIRANKSKLDSDKFLTEESTREEVKRLEALAVKRREFAKLKLDEDSISQVEYNEAIAVINEENQIAIDEANLARKEAEAEQKAIDAENELIFIEEQGAIQYEALVRRLEKDRQAELDTANKTGADRSKIDAKYDQRKKQLDADVVDAQINGFGQVLSSYASALGEQTAAGKAAAIAATLISTYQSAVSAFNSLASIPVVGTVLGIAAAGLAVSSGLKQVSKIRSTPTKLASGGMVKGKGSGKSDSIPAFLSNGESVNNARSTDMFAPLYSYLNVLGGGKPFASGGIAGTSSGVTSAGLIDYDLLALRVAEANESLPAPIVSVEEISEVASNISVVENLATS